MYKIERMRYIFIADAHLKGKDDPYSHSLIKMLHEEMEETDGLFILGDLFEFWAGEDPLLEDQYHKILEILYEFNKRKKRIVYLEGNHDFLLKDFFQREFKAEVYPDEHIEVINGKRVYLSHGDFAQRNDYPYLILRALLRSFLFRFMLKILPFRFIWKAGIALATIGQNHWGQPNIRIQKALLKFAQQKFHSNIDCVVLAHLHFPEFERFNINGREYLYVNVGGWKPDKHYLVLNDRGFEHRQYK